jgi:hypothetical protein
VSCPACGDRRDPRCATCEGAPPTDPAPPPGELVVVPTPEGLEWGEEIDTAVQCPDAMRKHQ